MFGIDMWYLTVISVLDRGGPDTDNDVAVNGWSVIRRAWAASHDGRDDTSKAISDSVTAGTAASVCLPLYGVRLVVARLGKSALHPVATPCAAQPIGRCDTMVCEDERPRKQIGD